MNKETFWERITNKKKTTTPELYERLKRILTMLEGILSGVRSSTELSVFLTEVANHFNLEMLGDWDKVDLATTEDTLAALE